MSRHRYLSTEISTDVQVAELSQFGMLPVVLYTWAIPHADDWGRMTGDARQFKWLVCPSLDVTVADVDQALNQIASVGLWERYEVDGKAYIAFPQQRWYKHQSYIPKVKREDASGSQFPAPPNTAQPEGHEESGRVLPQITADHRRSPQNPSSPSPSLTSSPSLSVTPSLTPIPSSGKVISKEREREPSAQKGEPLARRRTLSHSSKTPPEEPPKPAHPPNPLWDVLCEVFYQPTTKNERNNFGAIVRELKEIGATPDDVRARIAEHKRRKPGWDMTPNALVNHWSEFAPGNGAGSVTDSNGNGVPHVDWRIREQARQEAELAARARRIEERAKVEAELARGQAPE